MSFSALTSKIVLEFLPLNTWTEVILLSTTPNDHDVYICTTEEKKNKRLQDMNKISIQSSSFEKVKEFKPLEIVAVEIDGKWFRGKLISFNEFKTNDTRIELIDVGSFYETKLQNLFGLPYYFMYEQLALPIKCKNCIPKDQKLTVKPLMSESVLYDGIVLVEIKCDNDFPKNPQSSSNKDIKLAVNPNVAIANGMSNGVSSDNYVKSLTNGLFNDEKKPIAHQITSGDFCFITYFEHFTNMYINKVKKNKQNLIYEPVDFDILEKTAESTDKIPKKHPIVGDKVKVLSPQFGAFFRAEVLKKKNDGSYDIFYIDYGNVENVSANKIYELADELLKPGLAVKVGISDLKHVQCTEKIKDMFSNDSKLFVIEFDEKFGNCLTNVKLIDKENGTCVNNMFLNPVSVNNEQQVAPINCQAPSSNTNTNTSHNSQHKTQQPNELKNKDTVFLKYFCNMDNIYILKDIQLYNEVMIRVLSNNNKLNGDFNVGQIVKVKLGLSGYRAEIKKIDGNLITVMNIDLGFCEKVQSDCIYELADDIKKIPRITFKVGIKKPIIEVSEDLTNFVVSIEKVPLYLEFDKSNIERYQDVTLRRKDNLENIFDGFLKTQESILSNNLSNKIENKEIILTEQKETNDFPTITLENGDYCIISHFEDFKNIYLCEAVKCLNSDSYEMHNLEIVVRTMGNDDRNTKSNLAVGDLVKVFSPKFQAFYRAKILNITDNAKFHVSYIDFGNEEIMESSDIFELPDELKLQTPTPIRAAIEVPVNAKETDDIEKIFSHLIDECVVLSVEYKTKSPAGLENVLLKELISGDSVNEKVLKLLPVENKLAIKSGDNCVITHFENFDCIYISKFPDQQHAQILNNVVESKDRVTSTNLDVGDIVKVFSPSFQDLYRSEIMEVVDQVQYKVLYIDFGNMEIVPKSSIFQLSDELKNKPGLAIKIGINVTSNSKTIDATIKNIFLDLADNLEPLSIEFDMSSESGLENCILKVISSGLNVNNKVLKLLENQSLLSSKKNSDLYESNTKPMSIKNKNNKLLKNGGLVTLRYFNDIDSVFVSSGSEEHLIQFNCVTDKVFQDITKKKANIEIGAIVKSIFEGDMYRAKVMKKIDQNHYRISFIDFGNVETVHVNEIFELSNELKEIPGLSVKIGIKGCPSIKKTKEVLEYLDSLEGEILRIEYDEEDPEGLQKASLKKKNNCNVFDELSVINGKSSTIKEELIKKPESIVKIIKDEKTVIIPQELEDQFSSELIYGDTVFCCHFEDFNSVHICASSSNDVNMPVNCKLIIDSSKVKDLVVNENPRFKDIVRVKFENKFYRAYVIGKQREIFTVLLMDIGKKIDISSDNIYELPNDLKIIPALAKKVGLKRSSNLKKTKSVEDYFHCLWYTDQIPLKLIFDKGSFNYMDEVSLKKLSDDRDIIDDLLYLSNVTNHVSDGKSNVCVKTNGVVGKSNGSSSNHKRVINKEQVKYLHGNNVERIFIQCVRLCNELKNCLDEFKVEQRENLKSTNPIEVFTSEECCAVYSKKFGGVYRAKIIGNNEPDNFKCILLDLGLTDIIPSTNVFELPSELAIHKVPVFVHRVSLNGLTKSHNNTATSSYLSSIEGKLFTLEFPENATKWNTQVVLKELNGNGSLNEEIKKLSSSSPPKTSIQQRLEKKILLIDQTKKEETVVEKPSHTIKSGSLVSIIHFEDFNSIFVRDMTYDAVEKFSILSRKMLKYSITVKNALPKKNIEIGDKVFVCSVLNDTLYSRACIIDKFDNDQCNVFYMDYGNTELVDSTNIFELAEEFRKDNGFIIKVKLQNMPSLLSKKKIETVKDHIKKRYILPNVSLNIEFDELNPKGLDDVVLSTVFYNKNIADDLKMLLTDAPLLNIKTPEHHQNGHHNTKQNLPKAMSPYPARRHNLAK